MGGSQLKTKYKKNFIDNSLSKYNQCEVFLNILTYIFNVFGSK